VTTTSWQEVAFGELVAEAKPGFASGHDLEDGVFQFRMNNLTRDGRLDLTRRRRVPRNARRIESYLLEPGDVLFNATNSPDLVGKTAYFNGLDEPAVFSNHFLRLRPEPSRSDGRFLTRWLQYQWERGFFGARAKQWVNQATFGRDSLLTLRLRVPPVAEQRRIAAILDAADELRTTRQRSVALLDSLTASIFLDMFGDPTTNPKGLPVRVLGELGAVVTGNTPPRANQGNYGDAIEWIKSDNIQPPQPYLTRAREGLSDEGRRIGRVAPAGSILVTCIAGSPSSIGSAAIADRDVAFNQQINALIPSSSDSLYLHALLVAGKPLVQAASTAAMKGMVSKSRFAAIRLPIAADQAQRDFGERARSVHRLRAKAVGAVGWSDDLFASLQQRAFRGEL
jgi:type I restriction enzyme S subunit